MTSGISEPSLLWEERITHNHQTIRRLKSQLSFFLKSINFVFFLSMEVSKFWGLLSIHSFILFFFFYWVIWTSSAVSQCRNCQCSQGACNLLRVYEVFIFYYNTRQDKVHTLREMQIKTSSEVVEMWQEKNLSSLWLHENGEKQEAIQNTEHLPPELIWRCRSRGIHSSSYLQSSSLSILTHDLLPL